MGLCGLPGGPHLFCLAGLIGLSSGSNDEGSVSEPALSRPSIAPTCVGRGDKGGDGDLLTEGRRRGGDGDLLTEGRRRGGEGDLLTEGRRRDGDLAIGWRCFGAALTTKLSSPISLSALLSAVKEVNELLFLIMEDLAKGSTFLLAFRTPLDLRLLGTAGRSTPW